MRLDGFEGRTAFVTGSARGIGRRLVETFIALGARTAAGDLQPPDIEGALNVALDVTDDASVDAAFSQIERELGPVDILVLNAGIYVIVPFADETSAGFQRSLEVNLVGLLPLRAPGAPGDARTRLRAHRRDRVERRHHGRLARMRGLRRIEGRRDGARASRSPTSTRRRGSRPTRSHRR